jgi:hypothetical protein
MSDRTDRVLSSGVLESVSEGDEVEGAIQFLRSQSLGLEISDVGFAPGDEQSLVREDRESPLPGRHLRFLHYAREVPVYQSGVTVHIGEDGAIYQVVKDVVQFADVGEPPKKGLTEHQALATAIGLVGLGKERAKGARACPLVFAGTEDGEPRHAWRVALPAARVRSTGGRRMRSWVLLLDQETGEVLSRKDVLQRSPTGKGRIFYPNPMTALAGAGFSRGGVPENAYREVELQGLDPESRHLTGRYVSTELTRHRVRRDGRDFRFRRGENGFEETMAYYWIDEACRWAKKELGVPEEALDPFLVDARGSLDDQSWFDPITGELSFGVGGVSDAEDGDIILHEFAHALLHRFVPDWAEAVPWAEVWAIGEGFADFFSCCFLADRCGDELDPAVLGEWDAFPLGLEGLRRVDGNKMLSQVVGTGRVTKVDERTLTDDSADWEKNALVGQLVHPWVDAKTGQMSRPALIIENEKTTLTIDVGTGCDLNRRTDVGCTYSGQPHQDGQFWSSVLWEIYRKLGGDSTAVDKRKAAANKTLALVLEAHGTLDDLGRSEVSFKEAAQTMKTVCERDPSRSTGAGERPVDVLNDVLKGRGL